MLPEDLSESDLASAATGISTLLQSLRSDGENAAAAAAATSPQRRKPAPPAPPPRRRANPKPSEEEVGGALDTLAGILGKLQEGSSNPSVATSNRKSRDILNMFKKRQDQRLAGATFADKGTHLYQRASERRHRLSLRTFKKC